MGGDEHRLAQFVQAQVQVAAGQRVDDGIGRFLGCLVGFGAQGLGAGQPALLAGIALQRSSGVIQPIQFGVLQLKRWHRGIDHTGFVSQVKFHTLGQRCPQRLVRLRAAILRHHGFVVGPQAVAGGDSVQKRAPHLAHGLGIVFEQFKVGGQALGLQQRQRGRAQQRGKPAVKGANLRGPAIGQHLLV